MSKFKAEVYGSFSDAFDAVSGTPSPEQFAGAENYVAQLDEIKPDSSSRDTNGWLITEDDVDNLRTLADRRHWELTDEESAILQGVIDETLVDGSLNPDIPRITKRDFNLSAADQLKRDQEEAKAKLLLQEYFEGQDRESLRASEYRSKLEKQQTDNVKNKIVMEERDRLRKEYEASKREDVDAELNSVSGTALERHYAKRDIESQFSKEAEDHARTEADRIHLDRSLKYGANYFLRIDKVREIEEKIIANRERLEAMETSRQEFRTRHGIGQKADASNPATFEPGVSLFEGSEGMSYNEWLKNGAAAGKPVETPESDLSAEWSETGDVSKTSPSPKPEPVETPELDLSADTMKELSRTARDLAAAQIAIGGTMSLFSSRKNRQVKEDLKESLRRRQLAYENASADATEILTKEGLSQYEITELEIAFGVKKALDQTTQARFDKLSAKKQSWIVEKWSKAGRMKRGLITFAGGAVASALLAPVLATGVGVVGAGLSLRLAKSLGVARLNAKSSNLDTHESLHQKNENLMSNRIENVNSDIHRHDDIKSHIALQLSQAEARVSAMHVSENRKRMAKTIGLFAAGATLGSLAGSLVGDIKEHLGIANGNHGSTVDSNYKPSTSSQHSSIEQVSSKPRVETSQPSVTNNSAPTSGLPAPSVEAPTSVGILDAAGQVKVPIGSGDGWTNVITSQRPDLSPRQAYEFYELNKGYFGSNPASYLMPNGDFGISPRSGEVILNTGILDSLNKFGK